MSCPIRINENGEQFWLELAGGYPTSVEATNAGLLSRLERALRAFDGFGVADCQAEVSVLLVDEDWRFRGADEHFDAAYAGGELGFDEARLATWGKRSALLNTVRVQLSLQVEGVTVPAAAQVSSGIGQAYDETDRLYIDGRWLEVEVFAHLDDWDRFAAERDKLVEALLEIQVALGAGFNPPPEDARVQRD